MISIILSSSTKNQFCPAFVQQICILSRSRKPFLDKTCSRWSVRLPGLFFVWKSPKSREFCPANLRTTHAVKRLYFKAPRTFCPANRILSSKFCDLYIENIIFSVSLYKNDPYKFFPIYRYDFLLDIFIVFFYIRRIKVLYYKGLKDFLFKNFVHFCPDFVQQILCFVQISPCFVQQMTNFVQQICPGPRVLKSGIKHIVLSL